LLCLLSRPYVNHVATCAAASAQHCASMFGILHAYTQSTLHVLTVCCPCHVALILIYQ
jgi:hypothetical protein